MAALRSTLSEPSVPSEVSVMVVDDDDDIREIVSEVLVDAGFSVVTASNGAHALEVLKTVKPALILLDLNMPVMDGGEFRRRQRQDPAIAKIPTVVMSAVHRMRERIADLFTEEGLEKPVNMKQLFEVVSRYCAPPSDAGAG